MELPKRKIYTVSEFTEEIRGVLEKEYPSVWIQGEISNFRSSPAGHMYFTLKDASAQIRCVMFRLQSRFLKFNLQDGLNIVAWGRLAVYTVRGEYQLILDTVEPAGLGGLMLAFEQLRSKLTDEGLFTQERKRSLPPLPRRVGIITSRTGAAVQDMIRIMKRRLPAVHILLSSSVVQGDKAPDEIVAAFRRLCDAGDVDVIIIGRGGGSIEDLWAFNDERVVRAVAASPIPTIAAIGHETDFTLTDFAADVRASTPSAAAELAVPDRKTLQDGVLRLTDGLIANMDRFIDERYGMVRELTGRLQNPRRQIHEHRMRVDDLTTRLTRAAQRRIADLRDDTRQLTDRLRPEHLTRLLLNRRETVSTLLSSLNRAMHGVLKERRHAVESLAARLDTLSPLAVLSRGYSITVRPDTGQVLTDAGAVQRGDHVEVRLNRGKLQCKVMETETVADIPANAC